MDETGLELAESLRINKNLKSVKIERNPINYRFQIEIEKATK